MQSKNIDPEGEAIISGAFKMFDTDASGALDYNEMKILLTNLGEKMDDEEVFSCSKCFCHQ